MKTAPIRRPVSRALILHAGLPAVSLCYTAGFIPSRLRRCILAHAIPVQRRRRDGTELLFGMASDSLSRVVLDERRRRGGIAGGIPSCPRRFVAPSSIQRRKRDRTDLLFRIAADSLWRVVLDERRRRDGVEPGVKRSETPEEPLQRIFRTPDRGDGEGGARDNAHRTGDHAPAGSP